MTALDPRADLSAAPAPGGRGPWFVVGQYVALTKPRIIELLLITTVPVMFLAARGVPSLWLVLATLVGGTMSAGAANTLNCYLDRDIDAIMHRTSNRPLVTGTVSPRAALVFGIALTVASTLWLGLLVNWLSAPGWRSARCCSTSSSTPCCSSGAPRRTSCGAVPPGACRCSSAGPRSPARWPGPPFVLFAVVFFWTPPHYWPLSMKFKDDYAAAHVPMLPVVEKFVVVARQVVAYSWAMVAASLLLVPVAPMGCSTSWGPSSPAALFVAEAHRLLRAAKAGAGAAVLRPMRLFHFSITYLTILFVAVALDPLLYLPVWR